MKQLHDTRSLPLSRPEIDEEDIEAVAGVLRSGWITTGRMCAEFEQSFAECVGARGAVGLSSGTAGMHAVLASLDLAPGDEVITPSLTWVSTVNLLEILGVTPVFADVDPETLLLRPEDVEPLVTPRTRAIVPVHFAGAPVDLAPLRALASERGVRLIEDAAHAAGTRYRGESIGAHGTSIFSFHPLKNITTGEGGIVCSDDETLLERVRRFKFHGLAVDAYDRQVQGRAPQAEVVEPGLKYNLPDMNAVLGLGQIRRLGSINARRASLAQRYLERLVDVPGVRPLGLPEYPFEHPWSLFVVRVEPDVHGWTRSAFMEALKERGIGTGIHFIPVHQHRWYRDRYPDVMLPNTERNGSQVCSIPLFPAMTGDDVDYVVDSITEVVQGTAS